MHAPPAYAQYWIAQPEKVPNNVIYEEARNESSNFYEFLLN